MGKFPPVVAIVGPTATGKTRLALELAMRFGGEIVSVDSRQIYRYMDVGTAKPSQEEQRSVAHYMLDLVAPDEQYSAQRFREEGHRVLLRIAARGRVAFAGGGTGFYLRALLDGLNAPPVAPRPELRARLQEEAERLGPEELHRRLTHADPASAQRIHPHNVPRLIRALEIVEGLGGPVPLLESNCAIPALYLGLTMEREALRQAIDHRVAQQIRAGLVEETRLLCAMGYGDAPAMQGLGYRQIQDYLTGRVTLPRAIADYQRATRQYARRQMTWFRRDGRIQWIEAERQLAMSVALIERWLVTAS
jgi:tRNA dimethylallyltransferase